MLAALTLLALTAIRLPAQSMDDLNIQLHGYATQGFLYSNHNSWNGTDSQNGSAAWTEAVINVSAQPDSKLRIGVQARYFLLGDYGNTITLDWAQADYRVNEKLGFRVGKVKSPFGLLNETHDIDPAHLWALLPQSNYPIASRNSLLSHYGGVVYGAIPLGERFGKLEYRGFAGMRILPGSDGFFQTIRDAGMTLPNGIRGSVLGATLAWKTPLSGLRIGASEDHEHNSGEATLGGMQGTLENRPFQIPYFFGEYEKKRLAFSGEYERVRLNSVFQFSALPTFTFPIDFRAFFVTGSYKVSSKFSAGAYYSSTTNHKAPLGSARYLRDWTVATRYDFNPYLYAKAEQHFIHGTAVGFNASDNPSLQPTTRMTILKLGVSF
jgi:hypothetical protein